MPETWGEGEVRPSRFYVPPEQRPDRGPQPYGQTGGNFGSANGLYEPEPPPGERPATAFHVAADPANAAAWQDYDRQKAEYDHRRNQDKEAFHFAAPMRDAFVDPNLAANKAMLGQRLAGVDQRTAPTMQAASFGGAQIATGPQDQIRAQQMSLGQQLAMAAQGQGPSLAGLQMQQNTERALKAQLAAGASMRGTNPALGARLAAQAGGDIMAQAAADSAQLRMQEQIQARAMLGQQLAGMRGQDLGLAGQQAQLTQQAAMQNAGFQQQASQSNLQAGLDTQRQKDAMAMGYLGQQLGLDQQQFASLQDYEKFSADLFARQEAARLNKQLQQGAQTQQAIQTGVGAGTSALGSFLALAETAAPAAAASDRRLKTNIEDRSAAEEKIEELLALNPFRYDYHDEKHGKGKHVSLMAQDLEKTEIGRSMVEETPEGKRVNYGKGLGAMLAGMSYLHRRVEELEADAERPRVRSTRGLGRALAMAQQP